MLGINKAISNLQTNVFLSWKTLKNTVGRKLLTRQESWTLQFLVSKRLPRASHGPETTWCNLMSCLTWQRISISQIWEEEKKKKEKKESEPRYHKSQQSKRNTSSPSKIAASVPLFGTCLFFIPAIPPKVNSSLYLSITHLPSAGSLGMGDWEQRKYSYFPVAV